MKKDKRIKKENLPAATIEKVEAFVELRARHYTARIAGVAAAISGIIAYLATHPSVWHAMFHDLTAFLMQDITLFMLACVATVVYALVGLAGLRRHHDELARHLARTHKHHSHARVHDDHSLTLTNKKPTKWQRAHWHHVSIRK